MFSDCGITDDASLELPPYLNTVQSLKLSMNHSSSDSHKNVVDLHNSNSVVSYLNKHSSDSEALIRTELNEMRADFTSVDHIKRKLPPWRAGNLKDYR